MDKYDEGWVDIKAKCDDFKGGTVDKAVPRIAKKTAESVAGLFADTTEGHEALEQVAERVAQYVPSTPVGPNPKPNVRSSFRDAINVRVISEHPVALLGQPFNGRLHTEDGVVWAVGTQALANGRVLSPEATTVLIEHEQDRLTRAAETLATIDRMVVRARTRSTFVADCIAAAQDDPDGKRTRRRARNDALAATDRGA
jgi:hypothetical protein